MTNGPVTNAMSVDVEDYFQVGAFETTIRREDWSSFETRVVRNVERALELFAEHSVRATFFTLGWVAEREPQLVRRIVAAGHEIANHGYQHDRVHGFTPDSFRADLRRSRAIIEDAAGTGIKGYRAPSFSVGKANAWALEVLAEEGYAYSSSVAPIRHDHYGWPEAPRFVHQPVAGSPMIEVPVTTVEIGGRRLACGGGGFFRILPYRLSEWAIDRVNRVERQPTIFYFHPWEIDPGQPRVAGAPLRSRVRHYTNLAIMEDKLTRLLKRFRWGRMDEIFLGSEQARQAA